MILEIAGLTKRFGGITAVDDMHLSVAPGEVHAVVGPNGSGKTTLFNLISGAVPATSGQISFEGRRIEALPPHKRAQLGITRTFQNIKLFADLNVLENVLVGQHAISKTGNDSLVRWWGA